MEDQKTDSNDSTTTSTTLPQEYSGAVVKSEQVLCKLEEMAMQLVARRVLTSKAADLNVRILANDLAPYPVDIVLDAIQTHRLDPKAGKFWPSISDLYFLIKAKLDERHVAARTEEEGSPKDGGLVLPNDRTFMDHVEVVTDRVMRRDYPRLWRSPKSPDFAEKRVVVRQHCLDHLNNLRGYGDAPQDDGSFDFGS